MSTKVNITLSEVEEKCHFEIKFGEMPQSEIHEIKTVTDFVRLAYSLPRAKRARLQRDFKHFIMMTPLLADALDVGLDGVEFTFKWSDTPQKSKSK